MLVDRFALRYGLGSAIAADADALPFRSDTFDFLLSSHCLEHLPNTLAVLGEWRRVVRRGGVIMLILPHRERTFDRGRTPSTLEHHLQDLQRGVGYEDTTHLEEWQQVSLTRQRQQQEPWLAELDKRRRDGTLDWPWIINNGLVHYHAWTQHEMVELLLHLRLTVVFVIEEAGQRQDSFVVVARVSGQDDAGTR